MLKLAIEHSARCFFNSYVRDMAPFYDPEKRVFLIELPEGTLKVRVNKYSLTGMHDYENSYELESNKSQAISFLEAAKLICASNSLLYQRLKNSVHNIALSLKFRGTDIVSLYKGKFSFLDAEQALLIGHSFHPTPKSRDEFTDEDIKNFGPELGAKFLLNWFMIKKDILWEETSNSFKDQDWQNQLYPFTVPEGFVALPVHPWQLKILLQMDVIQSYVKEGLILMGERPTTQWHATSSMRSLYSEDSTWMIKFSMSVRLTNSIRHLQVNEVSRGMVLQDVLMTSVGKEYSKRFPYFQIMHEPAAFGIKSQDGNVMPESIVLLRENPFYQKKSHCAVLATLTQDNPFGGENLIAAFLSDNDARYWFNQFLNVSIEPLLVAHADYGIMLGAHQQNLIIELKEGIPTGAYFRDCQGTGFSELGVSIFSSVVPDKKKFMNHVVPEDAARPLFTYYLIVNSVMNTIHAVSVAGNIPEEELITIFREKLTHLSVYVKDPSIINFLLNSPELSQKGNFRCSLLNMNENTTTNPLLIYNQIKNPFYQEFIQ